MSVGGSTSRTCICLSLLDSKALAKLDQTTSLSDHIAQQPAVRLPLPSTLPSEMPITSAQKAAIEEIIDVLVSTTPARGKRQLSGMFMELVDRAGWPEYYEVLYSIHIFSCFRDKHTPVHTHTYTHTPSPLSLVILGHSRTAVYQWRES